MITLEFTRGGPLDGQQLSAEWPPEGWYRAAGGAYRLTRYHETGRGERSGTAFYIGEPGAAGEQIEPS
ncbi:MAG TPA: hypothetical protein VFJ24_07685 [Gaiellales bacterium]|nr:hypothetical protein [Gaiellales bacterium]